MKIVMAPVITLLLLLGDAAICAQETFAKDEDGKSAIRALIQKTEDSNNAGDVEKWVKLFAADAVYMPPGVPPVTTKKGLTEIAQAGFQHESNIEIEPAEIQVVGDWAFARSRVTGQVKLRGSGRVIPIDVKQLVIYQRNSDGKWRIARLISNSNTE